MRNVLYLILGLLLIGLVVLPWWFIQTPVEAELGLAQQYYEQALQAGTPFGQEEGLNGALRELFSLDESGNGLIEENLSHSFRSLHDTPWAIYYTYKALNYEPRNVNMQKFLNDELKKLNLPEEKFMPFQIGRSEGFALLFVLLMALFLLMTLWIWKGQRLALWLAYPCAALAGSLTLFLLYWAYFAPLEGVLVRPTLLYREPQAGSGWVMEQPLPAGLKVEALDERNEGRWLKIREPEGKVGYVQQKSIRLL